MCLNDTYPFCQQPLSGNCHSICFSKPVLWTATPGDWILWEERFYDLLTPIWGYAEFLQTQLGPESELSQDAYEIQLAAGQLQELFNEISSQYLPADGKAGADICARQDDRLSRLQESSGDRET